MVAYGLYQGTAEVFWFRAGFAANVVGLVLALVASFPGFLDWLLSNDRETRGDAVSARRMILSLGALGMFAADAWIYDGYRVQPPGDATVAVVLAVVGLGLTLAAGWLGWELAQSTPSIEPVARPEPIPLFDDAAFEERRAA